MKRNWRRVALIATLAALVGAAALGAVAYAGPSDDDTRWPYNFRDKLREAIATALGVSADEYDAAVETAQARVIDEALAEGWLTEAQAEKLRERADEGPGFGRMPLGRAVRGLRMGGSLAGVAAEHLGMDVSDLLERLRDGESIADVAEAQGVDPQTIIDARVAQVKETLDDAVADEDITQKQADAMLEIIQERVTEQMDNTRGCSPWRMGGLGRGMRGRLGGWRGDDLGCPAQTEEETL